ncbi:hypothetical protein GBA52_024111 [Prunus armeniaca]|nr:hypothetical protein GBA52_024111 [Prunus armeniaca]
MPKLTIPGTKCVACTLRPLRSLLLVLNRGFANSVADFISFLNLTKENVVAVDAWLVIMSAGESHNLDPYLRVLADFLRLSLKTATELEAFSWTSLHTQGLLIGMHGRPRELLSEYLLIKMPMARASFFNIHGRATLLLHPAVIYRVQQAGLVILILEFLLENASQENRPSGVGMNAYLNTWMNTQGVTVTRPMAHAGTSNHFPTTSLGFKGNEAGSSSHEMLPDLGLGQISQPLSRQYSGVLELSQQNRRQQHMELGHTRGYDSSTNQQMHWSL